VDFVRKRFSVSERRACQILNLPRSSHRYAPRRQTHDEKMLIQRLRGFVANHPRHGYRRFWDHLRKEGVAISLKATYRLWTRHRPR
jgi:putative transposase